MTSKVISQLRVTLGLDNVRFERGIDSSEKRLRRFSQTAKVAVAGALAGLTAGLAAFSKAGLDNVDAQAKLARSLGTTIDSLQGLQIAADEAGVANLREPLSKLVQQLAEASDPASRAAEALSDLNLTAADLADLPLVEQVALIADRIKELGLSAGEAGVLLRSLGVEQQAFTLLVANGGDAIRRAREDVDRFGLSLSEVDAAQVETANDAIARIGRVFVGLGNQLAVSLAPVLTDVADQLVVLADRSGPVGRAISNIGTVIGPVVTSAQALFTALTPVLEIVGSLVAAIAPLLQSLANLGLVLSQTIAPVLEVVAGSIASVINVLNPFSRAVDQATQETIELAQSAQGLDAIRQQLAEASGAAEAYKSAIAATGDQQKQTSAGVIAALGREFNAKRSLIELELQRQKAARDALVAESEGVLRRASARQIANVDQERAKSSSAAGTFINPQNQNLGSLQKALDAASPGVIELREQISEVDAAIGLLRSALATTFDTGTLAAEATQEAVADLNQALDEVAGGGASGGGGGLGPVAGGGVGLGSAARAGQALQSAFEGVEDQVNTTSDAIRGTLEGSLNSAVNSLLQGTTSIRGALAAITLDLARLSTSRGLNSLLDIAFGAFAGGRGGASLFPSLARIPLYATGTSSAIGGPAIVGERGPELVNLPRGSRVTPNHRMPAGQPVNVYIGESLLEAGYERQPFTNAVVRVMREQGLV